ncbi:MAG: hypothetical protein RSF40_01890 [Oscillospiraceae bacterium]
MNQFDEVKMYFKQDFYINDKITLRQPTIRDIVEFGEHRYFSMINMLVSIPSNYKSILFDMGFDYTKVTNFELFSMIAIGLSQKDTYLILGDLDLSHFVPAISRENNELILYNEYTDCVIDQRIYSLIFDYICELHDIKPKVENAYNEFTKKILIEEDRDRINKASSKKCTSLLLPLISSLVNSSECKYNSTSILEVGIYEFLDSVGRISLIRKTNALIQGVYCGKIDETKLNKSDLDWTRSLTK